MGWRLRFSFSQGKNLSKARAAKGHGIRCSCQCDCHFKRQHILGRFLAAGALHDDLLVGLRSKKGAPDHTSCNHTPTVSGLGFGGPWHPSSVEVQYAPSIGNLFPLQDPIFLSIHVHFWRGRSLLGRALKPRHHLLHASAL